MTGPISSTHYKTRRMSFAQGTTTDQNGSPSMSPTEWTDETRELLREALEESERLRGELERYLRREDVAMAQKARAERDAEYWITEVVRLRSLPDDPDAIERAEPVLKEMVAAWIGDYPEWDDYERTQLREDASAVLRAAITPEAAEQSGPTPEYLRHLAAKARATGKTPDQHQTRRTR